MFPKFEGNSKASALPPGDPLVDWATLTVGPSFTRRLHRVRNISECQPPPTAVRSGRLSTDFDESREHAGSFPPPVHRTHLQVAHTADIAAGELGLLPVNLKRRILQAMPLARQQGI